MNGPVITVPCDGRLAAIAESLRALAPITLAQLYHADRLTFDVVTAEALAVVAGRDDVDNTHMGSIVIEVAR